MRDGSVAGKRHQARELFGRRFKDLSFLISEKRERLISASCE
jgi:hypothetical protein